jgi:hypothetical protein
MSGEQAEILIPRLFWAAPSLVRASHKTVPLFNAMLRVFQEMILRVTRFNATGIGSPLTQPSVVVNANILLFQWSQAL